MQEDLNKKIDEALNEFRAPFPDKADSWNRLMMRIDTPQEEKNTTSRRRFTGLAIAASVAIIAGISFLFNADSAQTITTELAQHKSIDLPDGSVVTLNAQSSVTFDEKTFDAAREIHLKGEAFFEVEPGSRFDVITDKGTVTVLGTSFNVFDRDDVYSVVCATGKVRVSSGTDEVTLTPGLATDNSVQGRLRAAYPSEGANAWTQGLFQFHDSDLDLVFKEVERQFGVDIDTASIPQGSFTGEFESSDLESALTVICGPMGLEFEISEDRSIVVTHK